MKLHLIIINSYQKRIKRISVSLFFIVGTIVVTMLLLSNTVVAFQPRQTTLPSLWLLGSQAALLPTVVASSTAPNSTNVNGITSSSQDSQAQNDLSIANTVITWAGVVIAVAGLVLTFLTIGGAIAGYFGVREFRRVRKIRKTVTILEQKLKDQQQELVQLTGERETLAKQLKQLDKEIKSKDFLEAAYSYIEGANAYKLGDNKRAIKNYERVLKLWPEDTNVMERIGKAYSNLDNMEMAIDYLEKRALAIDRSYVPALRSLALCYRYTIKDKAIDYLQKALKVDDSDYETWDFLGLIYRDNGDMDNAKKAHEQALKIERRPETEFYLSIVLLNLPKRDKIRARDLMFEASKGTLEEEHQERIRPVWRILIQAGVLIFIDNKEGALQLIQSLTKYITTQRISKALEGHLLFLLKGTNHEEWIHEFTEIVKVIQNVTA